jgi:hypothetical protein
VITTAGYDVLRPFTFMFDDPRWLPKVLIGGLFCLASMMLVGVPFLLGYLARLVRNVLAGEQNPLPEWDDLGEYFSEGLLLFGVCLAYLLPIIALSIMVAIPAAIMSSAHNEGLRNLGDGVFGCSWCLISPLILAITFFLPAALLKAITTGRFAAAFEFKQIYAFVRNNIGSYLLAIVVYFVARMLATFGLILLCIGIFFTEFWGMTVSAYAFAQAWRLSQQR